MDQSNGKSLLRSIRGAVNTPRASVVAIVACLSAVGGAVAGAAAALIAATVLTPSSPVTVAQIALMALGYGLANGIAGAVLGTAVGFGALRRVPLGRLILDTNLGLAAGLTVSWLGGPWAWHHMQWLGFSGFAMGAVAAHLLTRRTQHPISIQSVNSASLEAPGALGLAEPGPLTTRDGASPLPASRLDGPAPKR